MEINRIVNDIDRCTIHSEDPSLVLKAILRHVNEKLALLRKRGLEVRPPELARVVQVVGQIWGVSEEGITSEVRSHPVAQARQVCQFLLVELLGSQTAAARAWGCSHSNVNNAVHTINGHLTVDEKLNRMVKAARHRVLGHE